MIYFKTERKLAAPVSLPHVPFLSDFLLHIIYIFNVIYLFDVCNIWYTSKLRESWRHQCLCHMYHIITFSFLLPTSPPRRHHHQSIMIISVKFLYSIWAEAKRSRSLWHLVAITTVQGCKNCCILPSWMGEHGVSLGNIAKLWGNKSKSTENEAT